MVDVNLLNYLLLLNVVDNIVIKFFLCFLFVCDKNKMYDLVVFLYNLYLNFLGFIVCLVLFVCFLIFEEKLCIRILSFFKCLKRWFLYIYDSIWCY